MFLIGEIKLFAITVLDRLLTSIKNKRWIGHKEYYDINYDELKRGN
jgi:hypothetical protein